MNAIFHEHFFTIFEFIKNQKFLYFIIKRSLLIAAHTENRVFHTSDQFSTGHEKDSVKIEWYVIL